MVTLSSLPRAVVHHDVLRDIAVMVLCGTGGQGTTPPARPVRTGGPPAWWGSRRPGRRGLFANAADARQVDTVVAGVPGW